jgi:hypothetical protein
MASPDHLSRNALGYELHTNRELGLMLRRTKPLAVFSDMRGHFLPVVLRYLRMFDRHAALGTFVKRIHHEMLDEAAKKGELEVVLYALPEEAWRIDAMIALRRNLSNWNSEHERQEGMLLGYTDEQNQIWIEKRYSAQAGGQG